MHLLIDNYDSFSYNLYQLIGEIDSDLKVIRNDELSVSQIQQLNPDTIIISPGPGRPDKAGICETLIRELHGTIPILGICLGHQAIVEAYGGTIDYAPYLMHGKQSKVALSTECSLFSDLPSTVEVGRYHSLAVDQKLPDTIGVTAVTEDGIIMGVKIKREPIFGLQFHPESILTPCGRTILKNFITQNEGRRKI